jgi:hypothetical protein
VFTSSAQGRGTFLYSIPTQAADETRQILLSHPVVPLGGLGGVTDFIVSPDEQYVLFRSNLQSANYGQHFSVAINGGGITKIDLPVPPTLFNGFTVSQYAFRPCSCSGTQSDSFWASAPTTQANGGFVNELWVNTRGGNALKINKPTGQLVGDPPNKGVDVFRVYNDYFVYSLNDGPNGLADIRKIYVSDWSANTWQVSLSTTVANRTGQFGTASVLRSPSSSCGPLGTYLIISDYVASTVYQSLYVYNLDTKTASNIISPALDGGKCSVVGASTEATKLYFICTPAGSTQQNLYVWDASKPANAAVVVNGAYGAASPAVGIITVHGSSGDYLLYSQSPVVSSTQQAIFAYNSVLGTNRALFTTAATGNSFAFQGIANAAGSYTFAPYNTLGGSNSAYVWLAVTTGTPATTSFFAAPLNAGTDNAAALVVQSDSISTFNGGVCRSTAATADPCAFGGSCSCGGCPSVQCSNYVTFSIKTSTNQFNQLHSALFSGASVLPFGAALTANSPVALQQIIYSTSVTTPDVPIVIYSYVNTGTSSNLFSSRINSAAQNALGPANVPGGTTPVVQVSQNGKWVVFTSQTIALASQVELYVAPSDGSAVGVRVSPTALSATRSTSSNFVLTSDNKYVLFFVTDTDPLSRSLIFSATLSATPIVTDLTLVQSEVNTNNNYVSNILFGISANSFHCSQKVFQYGASIPLATNPTSIFTVPIAGGKTNNVGFRATSVSSGTWLRSNVQLWYTADYYPFSTDIFVNTGAAYMVAPMAVLMLLAALLL